MIKEIIQENDSKKINFTKAVQAEMKIEKLMIAGQQMVSNPITNKEMDRLLRLSENPSQLMGAYGRLPQNKVAEIDNTKLAASYVSAAMAWEGEINEAIMNALEKRGANIREAKALGGQRIRRKEDMAVENNVPMFSDINNAAMLLSLPQNSQTFGVKYGTHGTIERDFALSQLVELYQQNPQVIIQTINALINSLKQSQFQRDPIGRNFIQKSEAFVKKANEYMMDFNANMIIAMCKDFIDEANDVVFREKYIYYECQLINYLNAYEAIQPSRRLDLNQLAKEYSRISNLYLYTPENEIIKKFESMGVRPGAIQSYFEDILTKQEEYWIEVNKAEEPEPEKTEEEKEEEKAKKEEEVVTQYTDACFSFGFENTNDEPGDEQNPTPVNANQQEKLTDNMFNNNFAQPQFDQPQSIVQPQISQTQPMAQPQYQQMGETQRTNSQQQPQPSSNQYMNDFFGSIGGSDDNDLFVPGAPAEPIAPQQQEQPKPQQQYQPSMQGPKVPQNTESSQDDNGGLSEMDDLSSYFL